MIFSDETTIRLTTVKELVWNSAGKKKIVRTVKHIRPRSTSEPVFQGFARIICFKQNLNAELTFDIY